MSKNTSSSMFRKVDVDAFDENNFQDDQVESEESSGTSEKEIQNLLNQKKNGEALKLVLKNAPITSSEQKVKAQARAQVRLVLTTHRTTEVEATVKSLDNSELDLLMKFIYACFQEPTDSDSAILLTWHEKVVAAGGLGTIVRVLTSRKTLF